MSTEFDTTTDDRVTSRTFTLSNGMRVRTYRPPQNFDLATASDAELARIGLPARPAQPRLAAHYDAVRAKLATKFNYVPASLRIREDPDPTARAVATATETQSAWSGAVVYASAGSSFYQISADWVVPNVGAPADNMWHMALSWIGIDGDGSGDICQAGVECDIYSSGTRRQVYPWFAWYPGASVMITNLPVYPGDLVTATICTAGANGAQGAGATKAILTFTNQTTGATTTVDFNAPAGTSLAGNCAEWVVSNPGLSSQLADYGEVYFSRATATQSGTVSVGAGTGNTINMVDGGGNTLSTGTVITDTIVRCGYTGKQPTN